VANSKQLKKLKQGVYIWNQWRYSRNILLKKFRGIRLRSVDLSDANLRRTNLFRIDLRGANLREADFSGADLSEADFSGADLRGANLIAANLRGTNLSEVILEGAKLTGANLREADFSGADLTEAYLSGANFRQAHLRKAILERAKLTGADLRGVILEGAKLSGANLEGAKLSGANLMGADLRGANLSETKFSEVKFNEARFIKAELEGTNLEEAKLEIAIFMGANLMEAFLCINFSGDYIWDYLIGTNLSGADLSGADLSGAILIGANLRRTNLFRADLSGAILIGADLIGASFIDADLKGADLSGTLFSESVLIGGYHIRDIIRRGIDLSEDYFYGAKLGKANFIIDDISKDFSKEWNLSTNLKEWIGRLNETWIRANNNSHIVKPEIGFFDLPMKIFFRERKFDRNSHFDCTLFSPQVVKKNETFFIQLFIHYTDKLQEAKDAAQNFDERSVKKGHSNLTKRIIKGTDLVFNMVLNDTIIKKSTQSLIWNEVTDSVIFEVTVPQSFSQKYLTGKVTIFLSNDEFIPIGHIRFKLDVSETKNIKVESKKIESARFYNFIFISYSRKDFDKVAPRVQMISLLKNNFFQDIFNIKPGEKWEDKIYGNIERSDAFFLFWSSAARESKWVKKEIAHAVKVKKSRINDIPEIIPVIIENPPPEPPEELKHLQFDDVLFRISSKN